MGGACGGKESQGNLPAVLSALAARVTGRPAKTVYDYTNPCIDASTGGFIYGKKLLSIRFAKVFEAPSKA